MKKFRIWAMCSIVIASAITYITGCEYKDETRSTSGVSRTMATVQVGADGLTVEQHNVTRRLDMDNTPGSIKHLYVISPYSGDCILYSTVDAKVTSSGKRLSPYEVASSGSSPDGFKFIIGNGLYYTNEVLQDDGTYGNSVPYIYWWDVRGVYHQHYVVGGQITHVSDQPMAWPKIILNLEQAN